MSELNSKQLTDVLNHFKIKGAVENCTRYGNGHINDTYLVICTQENVEYKYILQALNNNVFKESEKVMQNIEKVIKYLKPMVKDKREILNHILTFDNSTYYKDCDGHFWRMYDFVADSVCIDLPEPQEFYQCAVAFGRFQRLLSDFPANELYETIPNFHNTPKRYENFVTAIDNNKSGRAENVKEEIKFVNERKDFCSVLIDANKSGKLPLRVSHNDTKPNNVMLDAKTHKALCVIDLDTIMPGFSVTDFGDAVRFGASTAAEDEKNLNIVKFDLEKFKAYTKGFIEGCGGQLPKEEIMLLPEGAKMMTLECGMRFLTDYLDGDTYFKTEYPEHNLIRCRTQFKLVQEMEKHWAEMKNIVKEFCE